jgi:hypothetical protein
MKLPKHTGEQVLEIPKVSMIKHHRRTIGRDEYGSLRFASRRDRIGPRVRDGDGNSPALLRRYVRDENSD